MRDINELFMLNEETLDNDELKYLIETLENIVSKDKNNIDNINHLQHCCKIYLYNNYDNNIKIKLDVEFPDSMINNNINKTDSIIFELAPIDLVPYSIFYFLRLIDNWEGGSFFRNAGHVKQVKYYNTKMKSLAFQEYSSEFPHIKYSLGFAGRPGGPQFYISTRDNTVNHGPGSQGSLTEADSCFAKINLNDINSINTVNNISFQPGKNKSGFIMEKKDWINIISITKINNI
jgi:hypothetical protein